MLRIWEQLLPFQIYKYINYSSSKNDNILRSNKNTEKNEGYIPRLHIKDGVYVGDAVVKNHKGKLN